MDGSADEHVVILIRYAVQKVATQYWGVAAADILVCVPASLEALAEELLARAATPEEVLQAEDTLYIVRIARLYVSQLEEVDGWLQDEDCEESLLGEDSPYFSLARMLTVHLAKLVTAAFPDEAATSLAYTRNGSPLPPQEATDGGDETTDVRGLFPGSCYGLPAASSATTSVDRVSETGGGCGGSGDSELWGCKTAPSHRTGHGKSLLEVLEEQSRLMESITQSAADAALAARLAAEEEDELARALAAESAQLSATEAYLRQVLDEWSLATRKDVKDAGIVTGGAGVVVPAEELPASTKALERRGAQAGESWDTVKGKPRRGRDGAVDRLEGTQARLSPTTELPRDTPASAMPPTASFLTSARTATARVYAALAQLRCTCAAGMELECVPSAHGGGIYELALQPSASGALSRTLSQHNSPCSNAMYRTANAEAAALHAAIKQLQTQRAEGVAASRQARAALAQVASQRIQAKMGELFAEQRLTQVVLFCAKNPGFARLVIGAGAAPRGPEAAPHTPVLLQLLPDALQKSSEDDSEEAVPVQAWLAAASSRPPPPPLEPPPSDEVLLSLTLPPWSPASAHRVQLQERLVVDLHLLAIESSVPLTKRLVCGAVAALAASRALQAGRSASSRFRDAPEVVADVRLIPGQAHTTSGPSLNGAVLAWLRSMSVSGRSGGSSRGTAASPAVGLHLRVPCDGVAVDVRLWVTNLESIAAGGAYDFTLHARAASSQLLESGAAAASQPTATFHF